MTIQLRHETTNDIAAIEAVTIAAFANAPHTSHTEQFIVRARDAGELALSSWPKNMVRSSAMWPCRP